MRALNKCDEPHAPDGLHHIIAAAAVRYLQIKWIRLISEKKTNKPHRSCWLLTLLLILLRRHILDLLLRLIFLSTIVLLRRIGNVFGDIVFSLFARAFLQINSSEMK